MNKVILIGNLVKDPEIRYTPQGQPTASFTVAVARDYSKEKAAKEKAAGKPTADFIKVRVWGPLAENCANYLTKGSKCAVEGKQITGSYTKQDGQKAFTNETVADKVEFLTTKQEPSNQPMSGGGSEDFNYNQSDFQSIEDDQDIPF